MPSMGIRGRVSSSECFTCNIPSAGQDLPRTFHVQHNLHPRV